MELEKYDLALNYAAKCYNMLQVQDPRLECMLGKIYYKKGDLKKSSYFYSEAFKKAVSPDDLADMIEVFFMNKEYKKVISATCRYDYYDEMQNAKVHYICASAFLNLRKYDDSRAELETASTILSADENLPIDFAEEREIIDEAEQGKYKTFGIEDYIDYELTDEEYMIAQYLDENVEQANKVFETIKTNKDNYTENLKYLLSVTKALFQSYDFDRALDLCSKIDEIFDTEFLSEKDAKVMRKMINNLKRI
jgi:tetratricopeptide (TPR) repeat protein